MNSQNAITINGETHILAPTAEKSFKICNSCSLQEQCDNYNRPLCELFTSEKQFNFQLQHNGK